MSSLSRIWDRKTMATGGVGPEAQRPRSELESILLLPSFFPRLPLLSCPAPLSPLEKERGTYPGAASFTAPGPKGSPARHKGSGHCHSLQSPHRPESHISI